MDDGWYSYDEAGQRIEPQPLDATKLTFDEETGRMYYDGLLIAYPKQPQVSLKCPCCDMYFVAVHAGCPGYPVVNEHGELL